MHAEAKQRNAGAGSVFLQIRQGIRFNSQNMLLQTRVKIGGLHPVICNRQSTCNSRFVTWSFEQYQGLMLNDREEAE